MGNNIKLLPFQKAFIKNAFRPEIRTAALSAPRGNSKSFLGSKIVIDAILNPAYQGLEIVLISGSIEQARHVFNPVRKYLEENHPGEYRFIDAQRSLGITHKTDKTRLKVLSSNPKTSLGLVGCPLVVCDEPGSWHANAGDLLFRSIQTAMGKVGSPLRAVFLGTLSPGQPGQWWHEMIRRGCNKTTYVMNFQASENQLEKWDTWPVIRQCNPLMSRFPESRKVLLNERDEARNDPARNQHF